MSEETLHRLRPPCARSARPAGARSRRPALVGDGRLGGAFRRGPHPDRGRRRARRCRRPEASAATRASRTRTTWRGSSSTCWTAPQARPCSTPTTPSGDRRASSPPSRPTRATCSGSIPGSARKNLQPIVREDAVELGYRLPVGRDRGRARRRRARVGGPARADGAARGRAPRICTSSWTEARFRRSICSDAHFVLLAGAEGEGWRSAAKSAGEDVGVSVEAYREGGDFESDGFGELYGVGSGAPRSYARTASSPGVTPAPRRTRLPSCALRSRAPCFVRRPGRARRTPPRTPRPTTPGREPLA